MNIKKSVSYIVSKIDKCDFCSEKAEYSLVAWNMWRRSYKFLCEKHKQDWTNGILDIQ